MKKTANKDYCEENISDDCEVEFYEQNHIDQSENMYKTQKTNEPIANPKNNIGDISNSTMENKSSPNIAIIRYNKHTL